jgi:hypothetical protein
MSDTKRTVAVVYLLGMSTFCVPLINVSPPALGKTAWSMWDFWSLALGPNPASLYPPALWWLLFSLLPLFVHALLSVGLLLLWLPNYLKPSILWAFLCLMSSLPVRSYKSAISNMLEHLAGWHRGTVTMSLEGYVLPALLVFLLFVLVTELKDSARARRAATDRRAA